MSLCCGRLRFGTELSCLTSQLMALVINEAYNDGRSGQLLPSQLDRGPADVEEPDSGAIKSAAQQNEWPVVHDGDCTSRILYTGYEVNLVLYR